MKRTHHSHTKDDHSGGHHSGQLPVLRGLASTSLHVQATTELDADIRSFREETANAASKAISTSMPQKVLALTKLIKEKDSLRATSMIPLEGETNEDDCGLGRTVSFGAVCSESERLKTIRSELAELQREIHDSIQLATDVKLWVQLNIPRIEDGNNFGVGIQEGVVQELSKSEEAGMAALEGLGRWWQGRSKLIGKLIKYGSPLTCSAASPKDAPSGSETHTPHSHSHHSRHLCAKCQFSPNDPLIYAITDSDRRFLGNIWMGWCDLRNNYAVLYDMLAKNLEKIVNPRSENAINMY